LWLGGRAVRESVWSCRVEVGCLFAAAGPAVSVDPKGRQVRRRRIKTQRKDQAATPNVPVTTQVSSCSKRASCAVKA
jgi:hypothetical protein